jgi:hypothetical protein
MARSASKTPTTPEEYIANQEGPRREQIQWLHDLIRNTAPGLEPHIQSGMIGYGAYHYKYASGREGDTFVVGVASNKRYISLYVNAADSDGYVAERYRPKLPKADIGKSCVRFKNVDDVDLNVIADLVREGARTINSRL